MSFVFQDPSGLFDPENPVVLRNDVISALKKRDLSASAEAIQVLERINSSDTQLPAFRILQGALCDVVQTRNTQAILAALQCFEDEVVLAAKEIIHDRGEIHSLLAPLLAEIGNAISAQLADVDDEAIGQARNRLNRCAQMIPDPACFDGEKREVDVTPPPVRGNDESLFTKTIRSQTNRGH